ncbi:coiled-coil domain-containing protein 106-like [Hoplias malabaricus]|uniref:coiled-coil domain-containing protein 106-like n=1 Tax=Hoplias malabaricus TaxID=27720 RepID=UPI0034618626
MSTASRRRKDPGSVTVSQSQNTVSAVPNASHEIELLKLQLEAEKDKGNLREETIKILKQDKEHLQSQLSKKEEFIQELIRSKMEEIPGPSNILETKVKAHPKHQMPEKPVESDGGTTSSVLSDSSVEVTKTKRKTPEPKPDFHRIRVKNTRSIIARYKTALEAFKKGSSMKAAIDSVGLDRATIVRTAVVAELKIAAPELFDSIAPWNQRVEKLSVFVERCRAEVTSDVKSKICQMKIDGELLPIATTF